MLRHKTRELSLDPGAKYFFFFFALLFGVYAFVDCILNPVFHFPIATLRSEYSLHDAIQFIHAEFLRGFRNASLITELGVLSLFALIAYWFTLIALRPLKNSLERETFFAANAAHELATPLAIIKTTAEVVRMKHYQLSSEHISTFTESAIEEVDHMDEILKYFLHFAVPKKTSLPMSNIDMTKVVRGVLRKLSQFAKEKSVTIGSLPRIPRMVWGNVAALEEMTISLLKNSIVFSSPKGFISITLSETRRAVEMNISTDGIKIPEADLLHIFDPFFRGANATAGVHGFGLALVQEIAKLHHAKVAVKNIAHGVAFSVHLPK